MTIHSDGTVTFWCCYEQVWKRLHAELITDRTLATLTDEERDAIADSVEDRHTCGQCGYYADPRDCDPTDPGAPQTDPATGAIYCSAQCREMDENFRQCEAAHEKLHPDLQN
jgi:hypothetical protein